MFYTKKIIISYLQQYNKMLLTVQLEQYYRIITTIFLFTQETLMNNIFLNCFLTYCFFWTLIGQHLHCILLYKGLHFVSGIEADKNWIY